MALTTLKRASTSKTVEGLIFSVSPIVLLDSFRSNLSCRTLKHVSIVLLDFFNLAIKASIDNETQQWRPCKKVLIPGVIGRVRIGDRFRCDYALYYIRPVLYGLLPSFHLYAGHG